MKSRNEVIRFVDKQYFSMGAAIPRADEIIDAVYQILSGNKEPFPELVINTIG